MDFNNLNGHCQDFKRFGVIYLIINLLNGKKYVGQTRQNLSARISNHRLSKIKSGIDGAIQEYGWENFKVEVLEKCPIEKLDEREIYWIAKLNTKFPNGYNLTDGGKGPKVTLSENGYEIPCSRERRKKIMAELREKKSVYISDLAKTMEIATMTIRRDFNKLAELNIVTLIDGGAVLNEGVRVTPAVEARIEVMPNEKFKIARYCADLVKPGNAIYLDAGSTIMKIAEMIKNCPNIAVLTHSWLAQCFLLHSKKIQLFAMPGVYDESLGGFFGDITCRVIRSFSVDIAFLGTDAIDIQNGVTTPNLLDKSVKMAILERAKKKLWWQTTPKLTK